MGRAAIIKKLKNDRNYTVDAEKCSNCKHFEKMKTVMFNSIPRVINPICRLGDFHVRKYAICDKWEEK